MTVLTSDDRVFLESVARLNYVNPFLPERIDCERKALGSDFDESKADWNLLGDDPEFQQVNTAKIMEKAYAVITKINKQLRDGGQATAREMELYEDTGLFSNFADDRSKDNVKQVNSVDVFLSQANAWYGDATHRPMLALEESPLEYDGTEAGYNLDHMMSFVYNSSNEENNPMGIRLYLDSNRDGKFAEDEAVSNEQLPENISGISLNHGFDNSLVQQALEQFCILTRYLDTCPPLLILHQKFPY